MAKKKISLYNYTCRLDRVVDGDTADAFIDLGFDVSVKKRIRFYGVDTWESRTRNKEEKKKGLLAKEFTKKFLEAEDTFILQSHGVGKYGRCLGVLWNSKQTKCLNEELKKEGHAYEYHGEKKKVYGGK